MITLDCYNALAIKYELLFFVAENLEAIPILKSDKFILTSMDDSQIIKKSDVLYAIEDFLKSVNLSENFELIPRDTIEIKPLADKEMKKNLEKLAKNKKRLFFECTHCGFMTQYEEELQTHRLVHYI